MLLDYKNLHDGLNQAEINALYSILRKETIFTETLLMGTTGKYGVYNIVDTGIQVVNAIPTGQYTFNFSDGTVGVGVANDEGIVDIDISFDRSSVCDVVITFPPYVVRINYNLSLSADKSIIQKNESVVVNALLTMDGSACSGESLSYSVKHGSTVLDSGSVTTDLNGEASISYTGTGVGDVTFTVEYGTLLQKTYEVQDCHYFNNGSSVTDLDIGTGVSCTSNGDYITITTSTSGEKYVWLPVTLANTDNWLFEAEIADTVTGSANQPIALNYDNASKWAGHSINGNQWFANSGTNDTYTKPYQVGDKLTIIRENGVDKAILNDNTVISNRSATHNSTFKVGFYTNNGRTQKVKNIKLKVVESSRTPTDLTLTGDKSIIQKTETATITALLESDGSPVYNEKLSYSVKHGSTTIDTGTVTTGSDGKASISYTGTGVGDVSVEVNYSTFLQKTYEVQDCKYWNSNEVSVTGSNKHTLYDSNLSVTLPTNAEISFDVTMEYTGGDKDYRWWFLSKSLINGMNYPSNALFFDKKSSYILYNQMENGATKYTTKKFTASTYAKIKYVKTGTSVKIYVDDVFMFEDTVSWIDSYTDYTISMMKWSGSELIKMKNVKIKAL